MHESRTEGREWAAEIASLLDDLGQIQEEILQVLEQKRHAMLDQDRGAIEDLQHREASLGQRLNACHQRRGELLASAQSAGLPANNLGTLAGSVTHSKPGNLTKRVKETSRQMRLLQHSSLTNWVVTQRTLIHLSQMLEIIASGGRLNSTYGDSSADLPGGALVDREV